MREEFEKLPEIARRLYQLEYRPDINAYLSKPKYCNRYVNFVNGALYAHQEQQERIDVLEKFIRSTCYIDEEGVKNSYVECTELTYVSKLSSDDADIIKELLK